MKRRDFLHQSAGCTLAGALSATGFSSVANVTLADKQDQRKPASGPLRKHSKNPRYFANSQGDVVYLTGSHMWNNLIDMSPQDPPAKLDYDAYLDFLQRYNHNFIRMWAWELTAWDTTANGRWGKDQPHTVAPLPWARTGPGKALDGKPRFDLHQYHADYFKRLRQRVTAAGKRGIYVSVMLFEGWAMQHMQGSWKSHPFHPQNNASALDGDANADGKGLEVHTLANANVLAVQEAYVRKVIETVNDLDNVLYEITNENHPGSTKWQYHMIDLIHQYEKRLPKQHPVGMTFQYRGGSNRTLFDSPADWISPNPDGGYRDNPPAGNGKKVVLTDTDHLWGIGGNQAWVWKSFLRGLNPIFMDPYDGVVLASRFDRKWDPIRRSMGHTLSLANRMQLATCQPREDLASTKFCLANPGTEYLVYLPEGGKATVDLSDANGKLTAEWIHPGNGKTVSKSSLDGGGKRQVTSPLSGDAVLYVYR